MRPFVESGGVGSLGEKALIARVCRNFGDAANLPPPFGAGDDCALFESAKFKKNVYATTDAVILGRHFTPETPPHLAGAKLVKRNASDIAAMGARPFAALASSICSPNLSVEWLDGFCAGMGAAAERLGIKIVGGDFASVGSDFFSTHLTLLGQSDGRPLTRLGARENDLVCATGVLGLSFESGWHLDFEPRVEQGVFLSKCENVSACMDISDGVASDLRCMIPQKMCAELYSEKIPRRSFGGHTATVSEALCGGEDYELLFSFSGGESEFDAFAKKYFDKFGGNVFAFGRIKKASSEESENAVEILSENRREVLTRGGFDHYQV